MSKTQHNKKEPIIENKNTLPYSSRTLDPPISIIDQAKEIEKAEEMLKNNVNNKLDVILKQIRLLKEEAKSIIENANLDMKLHQAACNFTKIPGETIHLYEKNDNTLYFSRLSLKDWNNSAPHKYLGSYRMNIDKSFEKIDE